MRQEFFGEKFNMLTAVSFVCIDKYRRSVWRFKCDCGNTIERHSSAVKTGRTKSCGCLKRKTKSNLRHGMSRTPTYQSWLDMVSRCTNNTDPAYKNYGGRGIFVCDRWMSFDLFLEDMGVKPEGTMIERVNNDDGYHKENCTWADRKTQNRNKRVTKLSSSDVIEIRSSKESQSAIAKHYGITQAHVSCIKHKKVWSDV